MSEAKPKKAFLPERAAAWIAAFLLTAAVTLTVLGALAVQVLTSAGLHLRTATDGKLLDEQLQSIYASVDEYAEAYGFSAAPVKAAISREELEQFNTKTAEWWIALLTEGKADVIPRWNPGKSRGTSRGSASRTVRSLTPPESPIRC